MDLITIALAKKAGSSGGASGESGIITKLENNIENIQQKFLLPLSKGLVLTIEGAQNEEPKIILGEEQENNKLILPLASGNVVGLVKSAPENSINKISVLEDGTMEVNSLHINKLVQEEEILILDCSTTF